MIPIPYGKSYTSTVTGKAPKLVVCEQCAYEYVYYVERTSSGEGFSFLFLNDYGASNRATAEAERKALIALEDACEPVPCPRCGFIQSHMLARALKLRNRWMLQIALYLFITSLFLLAPAVFSLSIYLQQRSTTALIIAIVFCPLVVATIFGFIGLVLWRYSANRNYDPNAEDLEDRKQLGRQLALDRTVFEEIRKTALRPSAEVIDYSEHTVPERQG